MKPTHSWHIVDCPICGRPMELQHRYVGHQLTCGHCGGEIAVYRSHTGRLTATKLAKLDLLARADRLLHDAASTRPQAIS